MLKKTPFSTCEVDALAWLDSSLAQPALRPSDGDIVEDATCHSGEEGGCRQPSANQDAPDSPIQGAKPDEGGSASRGQGGAGGVAQVLLLIAFGLSVIAVLCCDSLFYHGIGLDGGPVYEREVPEAVEVSLDE